MKFVGDFTHHQSNGGLKKCVLSFAGVHCHKNQWASTILPVMFTICHAETEDVLKTVVKSSKEVLKRMNVGWSKTDWPDEDDSAMLATDLKTDWTREFIEVRRLFGTAQRTVSNVDANELHNDMVLDLDYILTKKAEGESETRVKRAAGNGIEA